MTTHYIGADVHSKITELAVDVGGKIVARYRVPTTIPALTEVLERTRRRRVLTFEEGPMADWLCRHLAGSVEEVIVCDPRQNKWIAGGAKNDRLDAAKLAALARGGYLKAVYHGLDPDLTELRRWVALYHQAVRQAVRTVNQVRAVCRMEGLRPRRVVLRDPVEREAWLATLKSPSPAGRLAILAIGYDAAATQVTRARKELRRRSRRHRVVALWQALPGVGLIRAVTLLAYLETPWRFRAKAALWRYCGLGLKRRTSGTDRQGRPRPGTLRVARDANRRLKDALMGAAVSAIEQRRNPFAAHYERTLANGTAPANARRTVARQLASVMWGMWKSGQAFDPEGLRPR